MNNKIKIGIGLVILGVGFVIFRSIKQNKIQTKHLDKQIISPEKKTAVLNQMKNDLTIGPKTSPKKADEINYFRSQILNKADSQKMFADTYLYFGNHPATFTVAKFMSMMPVLGGDEKFSKNLITTQAEIEQRSQSIFEQMEKSRDNITSDLSYHMASLNLVRQLKLNPARKALFYGATISEPIAVLENGSLEDNSYPFELALIMAKQDHVTSEMLYPAVKEAIENAKNSDARVKKAMRQRITNYYPDMSAMF